MILANPPFFTERGGVKPHDRFSIESKRTEVLFLDYMITHLSADGRAGIIVPEGILFNDQEAHQKLRKELVESSLVAVISLPAGVFKPYSGKKTAIIIMDKSLAPSTEHISFFKVESDGYDLGANRRPIEKNDLPTVLSEVCNYLESLRGNQESDDLESTSRTMVEKQRISKNGNYSLNVDRYRENGRDNSQFPYVHLKEVAKIASGNSAPQGAEYFRDGRHPFVRTADVGQAHRSSSFAGTKDMVNDKAVREKRLRLFPAGTILFPKSGASTFLNHRVLMAEPGYVASHLAGITCDERKALSSYVYHLLCQVDARDITPDGDYPSLRLSDIGDIQIPLPSLEVQQKIVAEIEDCQSEIDEAYALIEEMNEKIQATVEQVLNA